MGWDTVYQQKWRNVMNHWCRIQIIDHNRLNYKIYQWSVSQGNPQRKHWAYRIKSMVSESNIGDLFLTNSDHMNKSFIMNQINEHIKEHETRTWLNDIEMPESKRGNGRNKLRTYKLFKQTYSGEIYVKLIMQISHRSSFAKFRMGVSPLRIETGRYERIAEIDRICFNGNDAVESEEHVFNGVSFIIRFKINTVFKNHKLYARLSL